MRIAIIVHGRFHAFDLAKGLIRRGHDVVVLTNYPKWAAARFGLPTGRVRSFWLHGLLVRLDARLRDLTGFSGFEPFLHRLFGRWAVGQLEGEQWDAVHPWSGVSEEFLKNPSGRLKLLMRGSAHIRTQARILEEEESRVGRRLEHPSSWMIGREEREYRLADRIVVLSSFARDSFLQEGFPGERLWLLPLGSDVRTFRPPAEAVEERCRRILSGEPLRVLYVGALSFRKGLWDLGTLARSLAGERLLFRAVGPVSREARGFLKELKGSLEWIPKRPQKELPLQYGWADLFLFPTLQDGYAMVLAQAQAAGLPVLTTSHCGGPDLIEEGKTGWLFPIRSPQAIAERLRWCEGHRKELAEMARFLGGSYRSRDWSDVAKDFEGLCLRELSRSGDKS